MHTNKTLLAVLLAAFATAPVLAKDGHGHGKGHGGKDRGEHHVRIDRGHDHYAYAGCPPGLAKKNNGCLPPGQAKKQGYAVVGQPLPYGAVYTLPRHVRSTLPPPPAGYRYAVVNNQVVLVSDANIVVDIVLRSLFG